MGAGEATGKEREAREVAKLYRTLVAQRLRVCGARAPNVVRTNTPPARAPEP